MKPFLLTAVACLSALSFYLWTETDSLQSRAKQDAAALQNAQREAAEANTQLAEKNRQLESTQAALETANAQ
jgi:predicted  nucleic acid-binding Zn-ribbon protein